MPGARSTGVVLALTALLAGVAAPAAQAAQGEAAQAGGGLRVAIVAPLTVPPSGDALIPADELERYTGPVGLLTRQLDAYANTPVALGIDPRVLVSIDALGDAAPASAAAWLTRLAAVTNPTFALGYGDADPAALARAGALDALAVPEADPTWSYRLGPIAWPADDTVTSDALAALGAGEDPATVIVDSANVTGASGAHATADGVDVLVSDAQLSADARALAFASDDAQLTAARQQLAADLQAAAQARPGGTSVLTLDRRWPLGVLHADDLLAVAGSAAHVVSLDDVLAEPASAAELVAGTAVDADAERALASAHDAYLDDLGLASVLVDPEPFETERRRGLLALAAVSWHGQESWRDRVADYRERSRELHGAVQVSQGSDLLVLSNSTDLPVTVSNGLDAAIEIVVAVRAQRPQLRIPDSIQTVTVPAQSSKKVTFQAVSVANGRVPVEVDLHSGTGVSIGMTRVLQVDVQAQWETVFTIVGAGLAILLALGIVRNVVKRRRAARLAEAQA